MFRLVLPLLFLAFSVGQIRATERDERHVFRVQPGCAVNLDSHRGAVVVTETDDPEVTVAIHLEIGADTEPEADQMRRELQLQVTGTADTVTIFARNPRESRVRWFWDEDRQIGLTFRIKVPRRSNLDIRLINGSVTVGDHSGRVNAAVEKGDVSCRQVIGDMDLQVEHGNIVVSRCLGTFRARVLQGLIRTGTLGGAADLANSSGDVEVMMARGPLTAMAEAGDVSVGFPRRIGGEAQLTSRGGNIAVRIDPAAACRVVASSVWGQIHNRLPFKPDGVEQRRTRMAGTLNGGGPLLTLRASGGNVRLEPGETLFE